MTQALAIIGLYLIIKGNLRITSESELKPLGGRILGAVALIPFIVFNILLPFGGIVISESADVYLGYFLFGMVIITAVVVIMYFHQPIASANTNVASYPWLRSALRIVITVLLIVVLIAAINYFFS